MQISALHHPWQLPAGVYTSDTGKDYEIRGNVWRLCHQYSGDLAQAVDAQNRPRSAPLCPWTTCRMRPRCTPWSRRRQCSADSSKWHAGTERAAPKTRPEIGPKSDPRNGSTDSGWNRSGGQIWGSIGGLFFPSQWIRCTPSSRRRQCSAALSLCASTLLQTGPIEPWRCNAVNICGKGNCVTNESGIRRHWWWEWVGYDGVGRGGWSRVKWAWDGLGGMNGMGWGGWDGWARVWWVGWGVR